MFKIQYLAYSNISSTLNPYKMARTWIKNNSGNGNVLRTFGKELAEGDQTIRPNANMSFYRILDVNGDMTITIDGSKSLAADELNILIQATAAATITIAGDAAPGSVAIGAGGVGAIKLVNGAFAGVARFASYVPLS